MAQNTITVKGDPLQKEAVFSEAVTPGQLIEFGGDHDVQKHSTGNGFAQAMFAIERRVVGGGIDDDIPAAEIGTYAVYRQGDEVYAWLSEGESVDQGDLLSSNGDGDLQEAPGTPNDGVVVAQALESVDATYGRERIRCEIV